MHGAAVTLAQQVLDRNIQPDLVLADDMLDLATFIALTRKQLPNTPFALYMHENQLLYPLAPDSEQGPMRRNWGVRERQYVLINWKSMLAADKIFFNSQFHLDALFAELPRFLRHYADFNEEGTVDILRKKSAVLPVGIHKWVDVARPIPPEPNCPTILWNQRWEFDKNPAGFFAALRRYKQDGGRMKLIVCGESFGKTPEVFEQAEKEFEKELLHFGYANRGQYSELLSQSDIVLSTAHHEFFGISVLEAIQAGAIPLLPNRLSYPELIPAEYHEKLLYEAADDLNAKLHQIGAQFLQLSDLKNGLRKNAQAYSWEQVIGQYDQEISSLVHIS